MRWKPSAYRVERTLEIAAPADRLFGILSDLNQFADFFVLFGEKLEDGATKTTIEEIVPGQKVVVKLEIVKPMASTSIVTFTLTPTPTGSLVTWAMDGNHNFLGKVIGLFMDTDKALGADLEKGLAKLSQRTPSP